MAQVPSTKSAAAAAAASFDPFRKATFVTRAFMDLCVEALEEVGKAFPECTKTNVALTYTSDIYSAVHPDDPQANDWREQEEVVKEWYNNVKPFTSKIMGGDISDLAALREGPLYAMGLVDKINDPTFANSKEILVDFIKDLTMLAQCATLLPEALLQKIVAMQDSVSLPGGGAPMGQMDMVRLGQQVMGGLSQDDIAVFADNIAIVMALCEYLQESSPGVAPPTL